MGIPEKICRCGEKYFDWGCGECSRCYVRSELSRLERIDITLRDARSSLKKEISEMRKLLNEGE